ncbi:S-adenosylmethionine:tRNA ribosyltransferase-isomerase [Aureibacillus halotolerans]|uniref:S-adenosylmethionine:tRNA ribosyltransferase-isomerase n=1 Tax=Aureibacillus halotolerans TaxID=1508390 RepID=A0A4R6UDB5_9BACI|nr:S-adenosylmethionine:tRNA ribosyltransferase-isomerase [Aureibacillus halotolerans]TDQ42775.1 S-adenosylmethionine:tRNA ribosyltransferase-isomerase [Aureibacillus halotolerans]
MNAFQKQLIPKDASIPPEKAGKSRSKVRLLHFDSLTKQMKHKQFERLPEVFRKGDVVVLNTSRTIPAVLHTMKGEEIRLSRQCRKGVWDVLFVKPPKRVFHRFPGGLTGKIVGRGSESPLIQMAFSLQGAVFFEHLYRHGDVVRYEHLSHPWSLRYFQTVYANEPGSVEMPSAGRAFTWKLINDLQRKGVKVESICLHAGLSYYGNDSWPSPALHPEPFTVSQKTVETIKHAKENGGRVVAVGTTVVRALESAHSPGGVLQPTKGETALYVTAESALSVVDGLLTGFHEFEASHLDMLTAFVTKEDLEAMYQEALKERYLWHEFGDMNLILPSKA